MSIAAKQTLCPGMLPDIQSTKGDGEGESLSWVGMEQIDLPIDIAGRPVSAKVNAGINLLSSPEAEKGIHMSRLYLLLDELTQGEITPALLQHVLKAFLVSHQGRSDEASIEISGDLLLSRKSLNSNHSGWKAYPLTHAVVDGVTLPENTYIPSTERVGPDSDLKSYSKVDPASLQFSEEVASTNVKLVEGYQLLRNEF